MEYRTLGRTGVKVSAFCLGAMMFGPWGNNDEDEHQVFHGIVRFQRQHRRSDRAAQRGQATSNAEGQQEQPIDVDPDHLRNRSVVDRGPELGAKACSFEQCPEADHHRKPEADDKDPVDLETAQAEVHASLQEAWKLHRINIGPEQYGDRTDDDDRGT